MWHSFLCLFLEYWLQRYLRYFGSEVIFTFFFAYFAHDACIKEFLRVDVSSASEPRRFLAARKLAEAHRLKIFGIFGRHKFNLLPHWGGQMAEAVRRREIKVFWLGFLPRMSSGDGYRFSCQDLVSVFSGKWVSFLLSGDEFYLFFAIGFGRVYEADQFFGAEGRHKYLYCILIKIELLEIVVMEQWIKVLFYFEVVDKFFR